MPKPQNGHYHCLECGSLFAADVVNTRDQRCPVCGNPPTGKILAGTERDRIAASVVRSDTPQTPTQPKLHGVSSDTKEIMEATLEAQNRKGNGRVKRRKRKEKKSKKVIVLVALWLGLMAATVALVKYVSQDEESNISDQITLQNTIDDQRAQHEARRKQMFVQAALPQCEMTITQFLNASSAAAKAQYVYMGREISVPMARYYRSHPSFTSTRSRTKMISAQLLDFENQQVIGAVCLNSMGERFEVIFIKQGSEWKIDWPALVRHDSRSWSLFPAGNDGDQGVFRLYMRVRDSNENLDQKDLSVVFYKPGMYLKNDFTGLASSSVRVPIDSEMGRHIRKLLESEESALTDEYGFHLKGFDPSGYHRVRVKVELEKTSGTPANMKLVEILDDHWYGIQQVQIDPDLDGEVDEAN